jgi:pimeloyl-ACP methyl ester carboxylesterase
VAEILAADYDVIAVDARGHGFSEAPETGYDIATLAEDLYGVIAELELRKPAILGHSMGAITTLALAGLHPDVPRAILLEDPPSWWLPPSGSSGNTPTAGIRDWFRGLAGQTRDEIISAQRLATPHWSEVDLGLLGDSRLRLNARVIQLLDPRVSASVTWSACLPRVICPVLLITADPSRGAIVTPEAVQVLRGYIPQLRLVSIQEAGHSIHREQLSEYIEVVRSYLAQLL